MSNPKQSKHLLIAVYDLLNGYTEYFRNRVCDECRFSVPTFYRKMRSINEIKDGKLVEVLSGAEAGKIRELVNEIKDRFVGDLEHLLRAY